MTIGWLSSPLLNLAQPIGDFVNLELHLPPTGLGYQFLDLQGRVEYRHAVIGGWARACEATRSESALGDLYHANRR